MTTGHLQDSSNPGTIIPTSPSYIGHCWDKVWSGTDRPKRHKEPKPPLVTIHRGTETLTYRPRSVRVHGVRIKTGGSQDQHNYDAIVTTTLSGETYHMETYGNSVSDMQPFTNSLYDGTNGYCTTPLLDAGNDQLALVNKLREKLRGSDFDASVFLGEGHQTLRMLADSAIRIRKSLVSLKRGDIAGSLRSLIEGTSRTPIKPYSSMKRLKDTSEKNLANNWIELQYGWLPLVKDAASLGETLAYHLSCPLEMKVSVTQRKQKTDKGNWSWCPTTNRPPYYYIQSSGYREHHRRLTVYVTENPSMLASLGITQPENVLWELAPWSFVADWFIPIGQWLTARGLAELYKGTYIQGDLIRGMSLPVQGGVNSTGGFPPTWPVFESDWYVDHVGRLAGSHYTRSVGAAPSVPLPRFKGLAKAASWQHCANAVALLTQQFASKGR